MKNYFSLRTLILLALLAALCAVFRAFITIPLPSAGMKMSELSLAPVPVMLAGVFFGPLAGGIVGFAGETVGFFMGFQSGLYNPLISLGMALFGVIAGLFYLRTNKDSVWKLVGLTAAGLTGASVLISLIVWQFYGVPLGALIFWQAVAAGIELPVFIILMIALIKSLRPVVSSRLKIEPNKHQ